MTNEQHRIYRDRLVKTAQTMDESFKQALVASGVDEATASKVRGDALNRAADALEAIYGPSMAEIVRVLRKTSGRSA